MLYRCLLVTLSGLTALMSLPPVSVAQQNASPFGQAFPAPVQQKTPAQKKKSPTKTNRKPRPKPVAKRKLPTLSPECTTFRQEQRALEAAGVRQKLKLDPTVVAAGMSSGDLAQIRRLIELDEKLLFGCRVGQRVPLSVLRGSGRTTDNKPPDLPVRRPKLVRAKSTPARNTESRGVIDLPVRAPRP